MNKKEIINKLTNNNKNIKYNYFVILLNLLILFVNSKKEVIEYILKLVLVN